MMWPKTIAVLCFLLLVVIGCGWLKKPTMTEDQSDEARRALLTALDAWQTGQTASLATHTPPIRFQDDDFVAGWQLIDYQLVDRMQAIEKFRDVKVQLNLRDVRGKIVRKDVSYQIGIDPTTVQRSDN
jgi:hypothetical protein